jgi:predicted lipoprotein with Yx(FWY)xxD motif
VIRITASNLGKLGIVLTDTNGRTLYRFDNDVANPPTSNCNEACATAWPPLLGSADRVEVSGVDRALVGTVVRKDGRKQITVAGWPVYLYAKDKAPGEANGHGLNGTWFAVTPLGAKAATQAPAVLEDGGDQGGYGY